MKKQLLFSAIFFILMLGNSVAQTVYVTKSGKKYHTSTCRYINQNSLSIELSQAISKGYDACSVCKPDKIESSTSNESPNNSINEEENNSNKNTTESNQKVQCSAKTKKGSQCKRMTKSPNGKCWQHGGN